MRGARIIAAGLQIGSVVLGHNWGVMIHYPGRPPSIYTACAKSAGLLMLGGIVASMLIRPQKTVKHRTGVCAAALVYSVGVVWCEPFLHVHQLSEMVVAALVQVPLLLAIGLLVRRQAWLSVAGVTLFVFTGCAMIASNANVCDAGSGFFSWWTT